MRLYEIENTDEFRRYLHDIFNIAGDIAVINDKININGDVHVRETTLSVIPVQFDEVFGQFLCSSNLTTLKGCPRLVRDDFYCDHTRIKSFEGGPEIVGKSFVSQGISTLTSLEGLPKSIGETLSISYLKNLPLLRLLFIENLKDIAFYNEKGYDVDISNLQNIMNKYIRQGQKGAISCAAELSRAGFKGNARL